ncbi:MAG: cell wall-binding repeat-containing protein [Actinomycetota bacterium]|nr:cell wall-binding repeat-containing protein [Actinomycetota bacterium]
MTLGRRHLTRILALAVVLMISSGAATAFAGDPPAAPATVRSIDFESAIPSDMSIWGIVYTFPPKDPTAWWGRITNRKYAGSYGLWCAGNVSANWTTYGGKYPERTRGIADLYLPQLADYYSSEFSYYYSMPSYGLYDSSSFNPMWYSEADPTERDTHPFRPTTKYAAWSQDRWNLSATGNDVNLSRESGYFRFQFVDNGEGYLQTPTTGEGATVDNLVVTGYKYGPVRTLTGTRSTGQVVLNWLRPYRSTASVTLEERSITYRVWRRQKLPTVGAWAELTAAPLPDGTLSFTDTAALPLSTTQEYRVHAYDAAGSTYGAPVSASVVISSDSTPPVPSDNVVATYTSAAVIALSATDVGGSGVASISYSLNGAGTVTVAGASATVNVSANGNHSLVYWATDVAGNKSQNVTRTFRVDTMAPTVSDDWKALYTGPATVKITFSDALSSPSTVTYVLDGAAPVSSASSPLSVAIVGEGTHTLVYSATDALGNKSSTVTRDLRIDSTPPVPSDNVVATYTSAAVIALSATDVGGSGVASISYSLNGAGTVTVAGASATVNVSANGNHSLVYWVTDVAGNKSQNITRTFRVDTTAPTVSDDWKALYTGPATVKITFSDALSSPSTVTYVLDSAAPVSSASSPLSVAIAGEGTHTLVYSATDALGNKSSTVTRNLRIDSTPPVPSDDANTQAAYEGQATIHLSATDTGGSGVASISYRWDTGNVQTVAASTATVTRTTAGPITLEYWATDAAGNVCSHVLRAISIVAPPVTEPATAERIADDTRFSTAVEIAKESCDPDGNGTWPGITHVIVASGDDRAAADPLAAAGLCWAYDAPLFLVSARSTPGEVKAAIRQIAVARSERITIHVVGGPASVPDARISDIVGYMGTAQFAPSDRVLSTGGRYDLSRAIALRMKSVADSTPGKTMASAVLIANGADSTKFFDALALSPISARIGAPILLVSATEVPSATSSAIATLKPTTKIVGGGPNTVSETVRAKLGAVRWSDANRYSTATTIAKKAIDEKHWLSASVVGVAAKLPDALTGGSMVGRSGGVLLLTDTAKLSSDTATFLKARKGSVTTCYVLGGEKSVLPSVRTAINNVLK